MTEATVTKYAANRFLVEGVLAVIGGKIVNEPYRRVLTTKAKAEADAARLTTINADGLAYVAEQRAARFADVTEYLAVRAARKVTNQIAFNF